MFGIRNVSLPEIKVDELEKMYLRPSPMPVSVQGKPATYGELCESLGFCPAGLVEAELLDFFAAEGINRYEYQQVDAWLVAKKGEKRFWFWRPLREKDIIEDYRWGVEAAGYENTWENGFYCHKIGECRPYDSLVPMPVLQKVGRIESKFKDSVKFFVSDYGSPRPDPFIMVRTAKQGREIFIFDSWDEPGF